MIQKSTIVNQNKQNQKENPVSKWRMRLLHDYCRAFVCIPTKACSTTEVYLN